VILEIDAASQKGMGRNEQRHERNLRELRRVNRGKRFVLHEVWRAPCFVEFSHCRTILPEMWFYTGR
jgi:hypothetical protein